MDTWGVILSNDMRRCREMLHAVAQRIVGPRRCAGDARRRGAVCGLCSSMVARLVVAMALVGIAGVAPLCVRAAYAAPQGSLALECSVDRDGVSTLLAGDTYELVFVATAEVDAQGIRYTACEPFESLTYDWASLDAAGLRDAAAAAAAVAADGDAAPVATVTTNAAGRALAPSLHAGIYLVRRTQVASANADATMAPFVAGIPTLVDGRLTYDVQAHPKFELKPQVPVNPPQDKPGQGGLTPWFDLPTTGDIQLYVAGLIALVGGCMLAIAHKITRSS